MVHCIKGGMEKLEKQLTEEIAKAIKDEHDEIMKYVSVLTQLDGDLDPAKVFDEERTICYDDTIDEAQAYVFNSVLFKLPKNDQKKCDDEMTERIWKNLMNNCMIPNDFEKFLLEKKEPTIGEFVEM